MKALHFDRVEFPGHVVETRRRVRRFLVNEIAAGNLVPHKSSWTTYDPAFSRRAGAAGFIGVTWPRQYGGREQSNLDRLVISEEMLAVGAPCGAHWISDRQSGQQILRFGSERARAELLPRICRGECYFGIGMSEPNSGSDLAAIGSRGVRRDGRWVINGTKIWTTNAHQAHYLLALVRTGESGDNRRDGLTQFIIDMSKPGVSTRPIKDMSGRSEFNEVFFEDYVVEPDMRVGEEGGGWAMLTRELAFERSGPDRYLSDYGLLVALIDAVGAGGADWQKAEIGRLVSRLVPLMRMSGSISARLDKGEMLESEAALVKDIGTTFEQEVPEVVRKVCAIEPSEDSGDDLSASLADVLLRAPSFSIRGGTREILRNSIARSMGLR